MGGRLRHRDYEQAEEHCVTFMDSLWIITFFVDSLWIHHVLYGLLMDSSRSLWTPYGSITFYMDCLWIHHVLYGFQKRGCKNTVQDSCQVNAKTETKCKCKCRSSKIFIYFSGGNGENKKGTRPLMTKAKREKKARSPFRRAGQGQAK